MSRKSRLCVVGLACWFGVVPAAAQTSGDTAVAAAWTRVQRTPPGQELLITTADGSRTRHVVRLESQTLVVVNLMGAPMEPADRTALHDLVKGYPESVASLPAGRGLASGRVRLDARGVTVASATIAALDRVVERIALDELIEVRGPRPAHKSFLGVAIGVVGGAIAGAWVARGVDHRGADWLLFLGGATAGGLIGERVTPPPVRPVLFRRH